MTARITRPGGGDGGPARRDDRGAVSVEAALALCSLVVVLAMALGAVSAVSAQLRCMDAAREAARLTARGEQARATEVAARIAPTDARVDVAVRGDEVVVEVSSDAAGGLLPGLDIRARAVAVLEPGVSDTSAASSEGGGADGSAADGSAADGSGTDGSVGGAGGVP